MFEQIRKNLDNLGYHSGTVDEFVKDMDLFYQLVDQVQNKLLPQVTRDNLLFYTCCIHGQEGNQYPNELTLDEIPARRKLIADNQYQIDQQWHWFGGSVLSRFNEISRDFVMSLYTDLTLNNIRYESKFSLYKEGDFTSYHLDSNAPGRKCAVLIYLSHEKDYNNGGGKLVLTDHNTRNYVEDVLPVIPNYAIIDIEKHNLYHAVEEVKNNFQRLAYLSFIWNNDLTPTGDYKNIKENNEKK
jgi:hypothetical protein